MRHGNVPLSKVFWLLDAINGEKGLEGITADREFEPVPDIFGDDTLGQVGALYQKLDRQIIEALRRDEVEVVIESPNKAVVREKEQPIVDSNGRFIFRGLEVLAIDAKWKHCLGRALHPSFAEVCTRLEDVFQRKGFIPATQFEDMAEAKKRAMLADWRYANLFNGTYAWPFALALPQNDILDGRLGEAIEEIFLPAAERGYQRQFPGRIFHNYCKGILAGQVHSFPGSRQDELIIALREGPVVLWVFMNCLQGGSINADRELIQKQPQEFMLGGTILNSTVIAAYPEIAAKDANTPTYFSAADVWRSAHSLYFSPSTTYLRFDNWPHPANRVAACSGCSGSVAVRA